MADPNQDRNEPEAKGFPFVTVLATLATLFLFVGLVVVAYNSPNYLSDTKPSRAEGRPGGEARRGAGQEPGDPRRQRPRDEDVGRERDRGVARQRSRATKDTLPFPMPERRPRPRRSRRRSSSSTGEADAAASTPESHDPADIAVLATVVGSIVAVRRRGRARAGLGVPRRPVRQLRAGRAVDLRPGRADRRADRRVPGRADCEPGRSTAGHRRSERVPATAQPDL